MGFGAEERNERRPKSCQSRVRLGVSGPVSTSRSAYHFVDVDHFDTGWSLSRVGSKSTSTLLASRPRLKGARVTLSCGAARIWGSQANSGESLLTIVKICVHTLNWCRDPRFIRTFKSESCVEVFVEHLPTKKKYEFLTPIST